MDEGMGDGMSDSAKQQKATALPAQTQRQRWVKYGANVVLSCVVVIVLVFLLTYAAQRLTHRYALRSDTTAGGVHSLKPQSVNIVRSLKQKVRLVGLYPTFDKQQYESGEQREAAEHEASQRLMVADLLEEYRRAGNDISVEMIDPLHEPSQVNKLVQDVSTRYGGEGKAYRDFFEQLPKVLDQLKQDTAKEAALQKSLPIDQIADAQLQQTLLLLLQTVNQLPAQIDRTRKVLADDIEQAEKQKKTPDYHAAVDAIREDLERGSRLLGAVQATLASVKGEAVPKAIADYASAAAPRLEAQKKLIDDQVEQIQKLGGMKQLDALKDLKSKSILVLGEHDMKILPFGQVWTAPQNVRGMETEQISQNLRFAGEQQISTALAALEMTKQPKVVFIRPGGPPLTAGASMFQEAGPFSDIADRLRQYNFQVLEKDISGQWAMQARMQQVPTPPEPSDEEIKDAVWVVLSLNPAMGQQGPNPLGPKLEEHLKQGGSALVLYFPMSDDLGAALKPWGIEAQTDLVAVHEPVSSAGSRTADMLENAQRMPPVFVTTHYGDHPLTKPLESLQSLLSPLIIVKTTPQKGYKLTPLLPVPRTPTSWGEHDVREALEGKPVQYNAPAAGEDAAHADVPNTADAPLYGGAAVEHEGGGRVVALGSLQFVVNQILELPDQQMLRRGMVVAQFPGNAALFENSIFWLSHMETMLAISPEALQVSRIEPIPAGQLAFWRWGILIVAIPLAVVLVGTGVYLRRRD
jgi:hypothetical protein